MTAKIVAPVAAGGPFVSKDLFAAKNVAELFPSLVWVFDLAAEAAARIDADILGWIDRICPSRPAPQNGLSLQTPHDLHRQPAFAALGAAFDRAFAEVTAGLRLQPSPYLITGAWANISAPGIRHHRHAHPNNYLSGVYYVRTPAGGDTIRFHDPRPQAHALQPAQERASQYTGHSITIGVRPGRLVLFHSWLEHSVDANAGDGERISVAINAMFERFGETQGAPMWEPKLKPAADGGE